MIAMPRPAPHTPPAPTTVRRRLSSAQSATRSRLLDAAQELASAGGYEAVTLRDVARGAELSTATAYLHFGSPDELLVSLLEALERRSQESAERLAAGPGTPAEHLGRLLHAVLDEVAEHPRLYQATITAWIASHPGAGESPLAWHAWQDSWIARALGPGNPEGVVDTLDQLLLGSIVAIITGEAPDRVHRTIDFVLDALLARADGDSGG
jgi:AcrR family transcriptional regulator